MWFLLSFLVRLSLMVGLHIAVNRLFGVPVALYMSIDLQTMVYLGALLCGVVWGFAEYCKSHTEQAIRGKEVGLPDETQVLRYYTRELRYTLLLYVLLPPVVSWIFNELGWEVITFGDSYFSIVSVIILFLQVIGFSQCLLIHQALSSLRQIIIVHLQVEQVLHQARTDY